MFLWPFAGAVPMWVVCVFSFCLFVPTLNEGNARFVRHKLVYWSLNRVNEERSQTQGREEEKQGDEERRETDRTEKKQKRKNKDKYNELKGD